MQSISGSQWLSNQLTAASPPLTLGLKSVCWMAEGWEMSSFLLAPPFSMLAPGSPLLATSHRLKLQHSLNTMLVPTVPSQSSASCCPSCHLSPFFALVRKDAPAAAPSSTLERRCWTLHHGWWSLFYTNNMGFSQDLKDTFIQQKQTRWIHGKTTERRQRPEHQIHAGFRAFGCCRFVILFLNVKRTWPLL